MRKLSLRTCISCGTVRPQKEMTRLVLDKNNQVVLDRKFLREGRGAYVCSQLCLKKALSQPQKISRAFGQKVKLPPAPQ